MLWFEKKICFVFDFRVNLLNYIKFFSILSYLDKEEDYVLMLFVLRKFLYILEIVFFMRLVYKYL